MFSTGQASSLQIATFLIALFLDSLVEGSQVGDQPICPARCLPSAAGSHVRNGWAMRRISEFDALSVAVLPLGSVEQHGPHLPVGTDLLLAEAFAKCVSDRFTQEVVLLPTSPFGASFEHAAFPGTLAVPDHALDALWSSLIASVSATGLRSLMLLNTHGGQTPNAEIVARKARFDRVHPMRTFVVNMQAIIHNSKDIILRETKWGDKDWLWESMYGIHGGVIETSLMLYLHPEAVDMSKAKRFRPRKGAYGVHVKPYGSYVSYGWQTQDLFPEGVGGDTTAATSDIGRQIFDASCHELVQIIEEVKNTDAPLLEQTQWEKGKSEQTSASRSHFHHLFD